MNAPDSAILSQQTSMARWQASLKLAYAQRDGTTRPTLREHFGPLRALRGFTAPPGHDDLYEQIIVHPPGGVASGDQLSIDINAGQETNTLFTSPGAAKWYRSVDSPRSTLASQQVRLRVGHNASLDWLPMENIVFNTARAVLSTTVELNTNASFMGVDMVCLGRPANHEIFDRGLLKSRTSILRGDRPIFNEQWVINGGDPVLKARAGLAGASCFASLLIVPRTATANALEALCDRIRDALTQFERELVAVTALNELVVVRWFGQHAEDGWQVLRTAWRECRAEINGQTGNDPRIWQC